MDWVGDIILYVYSGQRNFSHQQEDKNIFWVASESVRDTVMHVVEVIIRLCQGWIVPTQTLITDMFRLQGRVVSADRLNIVYKQWSHTRTSQTHSSSCRHMCACGTEIHYWIAFSLLWYTLLYQLHCAGWTHDKHAKLIIFCFIQLFFARNSNIQS